MFDIIGKQLDQVMLAVLPKKLLFLSIDGVAPRAKMNQQRQRRFISAMELSSKKSNKSKLVDQYKLKDLKIPKLIEEENHKNEFDRNTISPGTPFMENLSKYLAEFINSRLSSPSS